MISKVIWIGFIVYILIYFVVEIYKSKPRIPLSYFVNPNRIKAYIVYRLKKLVKYLDKDTEASDNKPIYLDRYELVQYAIRVAYCQGCVKNTVKVDSKAGSKVESKCINCTCDPIGLINIKDAECTYDGFGYWMDEDEFNEFEDNFNWNLTLDITPKFPKI